MTNAKGPSPRNDGETKNNLSVVVPCRNEEKAIGLVVNRLAFVLGGLRTQSMIGDWEIVVVDDASTDATPSLLEDLASRQEKIRVLSLHAHSGYGAALKAGFAASRGGVIAFLDMDDTYDPGDLGALVEPVISGQSEMVFGERFSRGAQGMPWVRRLGNWFFSALVARARASRRGVRDVCTGYRAFDSKLRPQILSLPEDGLNFSVAMTVWALREGIVFQEIPVAYRDRKGCSKLSVVGDGWKFLMTILIGRA